MVAVPLRKSNEIEGRPRRMPRRRGGRRRTHTYDQGFVGTLGFDKLDVDEVLRSLPYADVCENNELRTYCISAKPLSNVGAADGLEWRKVSQLLIV